MKLKIIYKVPLLKLPKENPLSKGYKVEISSENRLPYIQEVVVSKDCTCVAYCSHRSYGSYIEYPNYYLNRRHTTLFRTQREANQYIKNKYRGIIWED